MIRPDPALVDRAWTAGLAGGYQRVLRPILFRSHHGDPEAIHEQLIHRLGALPPAAGRVVGAALAPSARPVTVGGITAANRVGLAAGLDKDGHAARAWGRLGFGFAELGTVTPRPQPGNDRPRLYRLPASRAIINRMGFNNAGAEALARRLQRWGIWRGNAAAGIPLGVSIGKNRTTSLEHATDDYLAAMTAVAPHADYVAINVSSPNTPGLRALQDAAELRALVATLVDEARRLNPDRPLPVWVKMAPDLADEALDELVEVCQEAGASALVATNTTLSRDGLAEVDRHLADQAGGLSGAPLTPLALRVVSRVAARAEIPVVGVGGVMRAEHARAMFDAGAQLVQLYTGFIYRGPALVREVAALHGRTTTTHAHENRETR
ncbi:quinone-dependent dihydroorotate dehydrogenase [Aestuariimicrobium ganziense]|uniref:quinone-dependent dihydroorotate dehydrogenase n=1 Tax=Aestuariimicrobium ganziense TaxID=2773677 RepID=UPI00194217C4|nr:quinone-dependent dihydroorotate dehydrogenase [Aestuariimicrobium ganziense]